MYYSYDFIDDWQEFTLYQENPVKKTICGRFTNLRIDKDTLPEGHFAYDIREGDSGYAATLEPEVLVNHFGTVVFQEEIVFPERDATKYLLFENDEWEEDPEEGLSPKETGEANSPEKADADYSFS